MKNSETLITFPAVYEKDPVSSNKQKSGRKNKQKSGRNVGSADNDRRQCLLICDVY